MSPDKINCCCRLVEELGNLLDGAPSSIASGRNSYLVDVVACGDLAFGFILVVFFLGRFYRFRSVFLVLVLVLVVVVVVGREGVGWRRGIFYLSVRLFSFCGNVLGYKHAKITYIYTYILNKRYLKIIYLPSLTP